MKSQLRKSFITALSMLVATIGVLVVFSSTSAGNADATTPSCTYFDQLIQPACALNIPAAGTEGTTCMFDVHTDCAWTASVTTPTTCSGSSDWVTYTLAGSGTGTVTITKHRDDHGDACRPQPSTDHRDHYPARGPASELHD